MSRLAGRLLCLLGFHRMREQAPMRGLGKRAWYFCERAGCRAFYARTEHRR